MKRIANEAVTIPVNEINSNNNASMFQNEYQTIPVRNKP
jgi:hypothetical protein